MTDTRALLLGAVPLIRRALYDPGALVKRGADPDGNAYGERLDQWQDRALDAALDQAVLLAEPAPLTAADLDALPLGAVVLDSGHRLTPSDRCAWQKSDDTELTDDYGDRVPDAWGSIQWKDDRSSARLVEEHGPITLLWGGDS